MVGVMKAFLLCHEGLSWQLKIESYHTVVIYHLLLYLVGIESRTIATAVPDECRCLKGFSNGLAFELSRAQSLNGISHQHSHQRINDFVGDARLKTS